MTLARHTHTERDPETATRIHMVAEAVRPAAGLMNIQCYQSREKESYYVLLSTWDDEESWHKARERHNPRQLLLKSAGQHLAGEPEQWFLHYLWGYTKPTITPGVITLQLSNVRPDKIEQAQQVWLKSLSQQARETSLSYAFFARGAYEDPALALRHPPTEAAHHKDSSYLQGTVLLNFFSWGTERDRETFYAHPLSQRIATFINSTSISRILALEPC
jgi:heme-degrading monooxygenase HmoA